MGKKYEIVGQEQKTVNVLDKDIEATFYRIKALVDIPNKVKAGELGGLISSEEALSQDDNSWVDEDSIVYDSLLDGDIFIEDSKVCNCSIEATYCEIVSSHLSFVNVIAPVDIVVIEDSSLAFQYIYAQVDIQSCDLFEVRTFNHAAYYGYTDDKGLENEMFLDIPGFSFHRRDDDIMVNAEMAASINSLKTVAGRIQFIEKIDEEISVLSKQEKEKFSKILAFMVEDNEDGR